MAYKQKNNPFKNIFSSIGNFARSKQSDVAGTISGVNVTNEEIGELRRTARYNQSFRERMEARKQLRDFEKGARADVVEDDPVEEEVVEQNDDDLRDTDEGLLPPVPGHEGDPYSYKIEDGQYFYKLGDGDWVPAKGKSLEAIQERYGEDTSEITTASGGDTTTDLPVEETTDPPVDVNIPEKKENIVEKIVEKTVKPKIKPKPKQNFNFGGPGFDYSGDKYTGKLRFPELGKWDYRNAPGYKGTDPNYPLP